MVVDGDTLTIDGERIRLWGVNAPEQDQTCRRHGQDYRCGEGARQALREWIGQSAVSCVEVEKDQYGRRVARCAVDGQDIGAWMVSQGLALDYRRYSAGVYARDEASARAAARGLHAGTFEPAWAWRAARRNDRPEQGPPQPACAIKGNINAKGARYYHAPGTVNANAADAAAWQAKYDAANAQQRALMVNAAYNFTIGMMRNVALGQQAPRGRRGRWRHADRGQRPRGRRRLSS